MNFRNHCGSFQIFVAVVVNIPAEAFQSEHLHIQKMYRNLKLK